MILVKSYRKNSIYFFLKVYHPPSTIQLYIFCSILVRIIRRWCWYAVCVFSLFLLRSVQYIVASPGKVPITVHACFTINVEPLSTGVTNVIVALWRSFIIHYKRFVHKRTLSCHIYNIVWIYVIVVYVYRVTQERYISYWCYISCSMHSIRRYSRVPCADYL